MPDAKTPEGPGVGPAPQFQTSSTPGLNYDVNLRDIASALKNSGVTAPQNAPVMGSDAYQAQADAFNKAKGERGLRGEVMAYNYNENVISR